MGIRFIDHFKVILLDMGHTFMFDCDRFSDDEDFWATYCETGGHGLSAHDVRRIVPALYSHVLTAYRDNSIFDRFPTMHDLIASLPETANLPSIERKILEDVFAAHEVGTVSHDHVEVLREFRKTHRLGVVSNVWSDSSWYLIEFERAGIRHLFDTIIFSSDHGCIKPSAVLFEKAITAFSVDRSQIVFVGDSLKRDIEGAKAVGLTAVWIENDRSLIHENLPKPDLTIKDLKHLLTA